MNIVVYRGPKPVTHKGLTYDPGVPTPMPTDAWEKVNPVDWEIWKPGSPGAVGRPILIQPPYKEGLAVLSRFFIEIVKTRFPTCPIHLYGTQAEYKCIYDGLVTRFHTEITGKEKKALNPYREWSMANGERATMAASLHGMRRASYGYQAALAFEVLEGPDPEPLPYPEKADKQGDYAVVIESGATVGRTYTDLAPALKAVTGAFPIRWIRGMKLNALAKDLETIQGAKVVICCGETPLAFMAANYGKQMLVATADDNAGGMFRAQLYPALQPDGTGYVKAIRMNGGDGVDLVAERIVETLHQMFTNVPRSASRESDTVILTPKPVEEPKRRRRRKDEDQLMEGIAEVAPALTEVFRDVTEQVDDVAHAAEEAAEGFSGLADAIETPKYFEGYTEVPQEQIDKEIEALRNSPRFRAVIEALQGGDDESDD